jgi:acetylornithine deacetylase/succinyl-diaminopimelate desuccinylase-like protein
MTTPPNWPTATDETVQHLSRLIRAETINPPGNELPAILIIKDILESEGMIADRDFKILESAPGRVNLVARLRGDGSQRPFFMSGHVDVVPVEREHWKHDPFGGEVIDGEVWGRGAMDMKGFLAMYLQTFLQIRRQGRPLKRDIILAAIADEENGFTHGSKFLVQQHRELIDAEYGITESGGFTTYLGKTRLYAIQVAEKGVCWMRMKAKGRPGHASMPHDDNAVMHLAQAVERIRRAGHLPVHITPTFRAMVKAGGSQIRSPLARFSGALTNPTVVSFLLPRLKGFDKSLLTALTTNTCTPTVLHGGSKTNVIPSDAEVQLDCRKLPGQSVEDVQREILAITGDKVTLEVIQASNGAEFPTETPFYAALDRATRQLDPNGIVIPLLMPGATDASAYQAAGIKMYGFTPGILSADFPAIALAHGHDERIPVSYIASGLPILWNVLNEICAA